MLHRMLERLLTQFFLVCHVRRTSSEGGHVRAGEPHDHSDHGRVGIVSQCIQTTSNAHCAHLLLPSCSYSISAAFAKCQIELYIAAFLQRRFKKSPNLFLLAIMMMGLFLSMWISNHTAPVLCVSVSDKHCHISSSLLLLLTVLCI
jgi:hypothetical protein